MNNNISFKAKFISPATIKRHYCTKSPQEKVVSFIEFNSRSLKDRKALSAVDALWGEGDTFASSIARDIDDDIIFSLKNGRYFALTTQRKQLDEPVADKVLGVAEVRREKENLIQLKYLQAHPDNTCFSYYKVYSGIGTAILDALKSLFPNDDIILSSVESAKEFYKFNGFEELDKSSNVLKFKRSASTNLPKWLQFLT